MWYVRCWGDGVSQFSKVRVFLEDSSTFLKGIATLCFFFSVITFWSAFNTKLPDVSKMIAINVVPEDFSTFRSVATRRKDAVTDLGYAFKVSLEKIKNHTKKTLNFCCQDCILRLGTSPLYNYINP